MRKKNFSNTFFLMVILVPICLGFFTLFSRESNAKQADIIYEDGRIGVILERIERSVEYPSEWRVVGNRYLPPKEGHDYVVVFFKMEVIKNIHVVGFGGRGDEKSILCDAKGKKYKLATWNSKGWKYMNPNKGFKSPVELVQGAKGIMIFVFPKQKKPSELSFIYYFKKTCEDKHKQEGSIRIAINPNRY